MMASENTKPVKKGKKIEWRPANTLDYLNAAEGHTARWVRNDEANIQKKMAEGWVAINKVTAPGANLDRKMTSAVQDGVQMTSSIQYRELVAMELPAELKEARDEYYKQRTAEQINGRIRATDAKNEMGIHSDKLTPVLKID